MASELARGFHRDIDLNTGPTVTMVGDTAVIIDSDGDLDSMIDPQSGAMKIESDDGGVIIDLNPQIRGKKARGEEEFSENLAEIMSDQDMNLIAADLIQAIEADDRSRDEWLNTRAKGIDMLGFKVEESASGGTSASSPVSNMSSVRHPLLAEAVIRFQANASAELYPAEGPVKIRNDATPMPSAVSAQLAAGMAAGNPMPTESDDLAEALEKDFNHFLTSTDKGYRPDSVRMLFWTGFGGCGFKKVYNDPVRRMPLSRAVDAQDLIVNNNANDLDDAGRITHKIKMRRSTFVRMQIAGAYRRCDTGIMPTEAPNAVESKVAQVQGLSDRSQRPEDAEFTIYECYCELDLPGYEHLDEDGNPTGLELPYRVSIEKDSRQILEIRRNWREDDQTCRAKKVFVKYPFVAAFGFYDVGLLHILGNTDRALTGAWRLMLDAGMFSNFPGFLYADTAGRQVTNEFRVPPGGGAKVNTGGQPIGSVVMPLPYKDISAGLMGLTQQIEAAGQRIGGTAELQVAEGRQDAPVGTTLAMIEQATKVLAAVHINLHAAQAEEFQLLKECFRDDPEAFWRHNRNPSRPWEIEQFLQALEDTDIVPSADPNTPSHMHRIMKAVAIKQLQGANPTLYDGKAVDERILRMIGINNPDALFAPPQPPPSPPIDPIKQAGLQLKAQEMSIKEKDADQDLAIKEMEARARMQSELAGHSADNAAAAHTDDTRLEEIKIQSADRASDRASRERVALIREQTEQLKMQHESAGRWNPGFADGGAVKEYGGQE